MNITLPDYIFPAVAIFENDSPTKPTIFTIFIYNSQSSPLYIAWFHDNQKESITLYKEDEKWLEKKTKKETVMSKIIGTAIELYNPYK